MKKKMTKAKFNIHVLIYALVIFVVLGMTTGFALYNRIINTSGTLSINKVGKIIVSNVEYVEGSNVDITYEPSFTDDSIDFNTRFTDSGETDYYATYRVSLTNSAIIENTLESLNLSSLELVSSVDNDPAEIDAVITGPVTAGYVFEPNETASVLVTISITNPTGGATYDVTGEVAPESNPGSTYSLMASIEDPKSGDLTGSNIRAPFTLDVISTYEENTQFSLSLTSSNYRVVDSNGNAWGNQTIVANSEDSYVFYVEVIDPTKVTTNSQTLGVIISANGNSKFVDNVVLAVEKYEEAVDEDAPVISNLSFAQSTTYADRGKGTLTWIGNDDSTITSYTIIVYKKAANASGFTPTTISNVGTNSYSFDNLEEDAQYYFKVYGIDEHGNTATTEEINSGTSNAHCATTSTTTCEWVFSITGNISNGSLSTTGTVNMGGTYTGTLNANNNYSRPNTITVTMGGQTLAASQYSYSNNNGRITISNVTGPVVITATCNWTCLVEGTKIRLYDGSCKNVEDIGYDDLLAVWSYDEGKIVPDYPIWIEKEIEVSFYQLTTFEDGSYLKTAGFHGIFSVDLNMFVPVDNRDLFNVGTTVIKLDEEGNQYTTKVAKIEIINETVNHYHILSTKFFNIIANDFLTTDGTVILSNIFGFDENITWPKSRYEIITNKDNLFKYEDYKDIVPYHLFMGCRAYEAKVICDNGFMTTADFEKYLYENVVNPNMLKTPIQDRDGNNLWMMTTSLDNVNGLNKRTFMHKEGSIFKLPEVQAKDGLKPYWYNAVRNEYYECNEKIRVDYSMHFELVYR